MIDARKLAAGSVLDADVCVIGSGPAGGSLAEELAGRGMNVVVLEGGGLRSSRLHSDTYRGVVGGGAHDPLEVVRQKRVGGTSAQWGGRCAPLDDIDFAERDWIPGSGWPITPEDLQPFYPRAQRHLDAGEYEYSAARSGFPPAPAAESTILDWDHTWRWSPPTKFAARMRRLAQGGNVRLLVEATVVRLERDPVSGAVVEAVAAPRPGVEITVRAPAYVLAAGGLESTRILLASDRQSPAGIGNEYDQVGRHYMTHPVGEVGTVALSDAGRALALGYVTTSDGIYSRRMLGLTPQVQREHRLGNLKAALWFPDPMTPDHHDGLLSTFALTYWGLGKARLGFKSAGTHAAYTGTTGIGRHVRNVAADWRRVGRFARSWAAPRLTGRRVLPSFMPLDGAFCRLRFDAEQSPSSANRVTLDSERDALGQRRLRVAYSVSESDRERIRTGMTLIGEEFARLGLGTVALDDVDRIGDMAFTDGTHQMGLLRMSHSPRAGVVDPQCRVHGCANLYVASSAVFPTAGAVGPTLAIVALACRIADRVAELVVR
nr:GMC family oxidoreductase [Pseudonocardia acidicola]